MTTALFGKPYTPGARSISFSSPVKTFLAWRIDEVIDVLEASNAEALAGNFVVLMICYEAAEAFDSALTTHTTCPLPLVWAGIFPEDSTPRTELQGRYSASEWTPLVSRTEYDAAVARVRELIADGDTYQVNYSFPLKSKFSGDPLAWYHDLNLAQGGQYSAFLDLGRHKVLSLSPELFFERTGDHVRTKPMKGTVRRGRWSTEDSELAAWLANSSKDKAENVMIVDLLRNDLGKVSIPGSVRVSSLFELERFETVWQMTSTVESTLRPHTSLVELLSALFPCGSITGAPKIRTMEIIRELEPFPRGIYTGAIGLIKPGGDCSFNVAIRTVVVDSETGTAVFGVGGGVTIDSTAEREYDECLVKAKFLSNPPRSFELFETFLLEDGEYFLLERHIDRLKSSANYFGFNFAEPTTKSVLYGFAKSNPEGSWKVKLTLARDGSVSTKLSQLVNDNEKVLRVCLADSAINSGDRLIFHKTTHRDFYSSQLENHPGCDDIIFFNEQGEVTESTIANVVIRLEGELVTPPISAGLLAGTYRNQLIDEGTIKERSITTADLRSADEFFLVNSVRKWMKAIVSNL